MLQSNGRSARSAPTIAPESPTGTPPPATVDGMARTVAIGLTLLAVAIAAACTAPAGPQPSEDDPPEITRPQPAPTDPEPGPSPQPPEPTIQHVRIDFVEETPGYSAEGFAGLGILLDPPQGHLDAAAWQVIGFSDGDLLYGQESAEGDFARGLSAGGVATGGLYAFMVEEDRVALGVQPTATDFAPGSIAVRVPITLDAVERVTVAYSLWVYNDQSRSQAWSFALSGDGETWFEYPELTHITPAEADADPYWRRSDFELHIQTPPFTSGAGDWIHARWSAEDHGGSGGRDEVAIGTIVIEVSAAPAQ